MSKKLTIKIPCESASWLYKKLLNSSEGSDGRAHCSLICKELGSLLPSTTIEACGSTVSGAQHGAKAAK